jgi:hypothetical protein
MHACIGTPTKPAALWCCSATAGLANTVHQRTRTILSLGRAVEHVGGPKAKAVLHMLVHILHSTRWRLLSRVGICIGGPRCTAGRAPAVDNCEGASRSGGTEFGVEGHSLCSRGQHACHRALQGVQALPQVVLQALLSLSLQCCTRPTRPLTNRITLGYFFKACHRVAVHATCAD